VREIVTHQLVILTAPNLRCISRTLASRPETKRSTGILVTLPSGKPPPVHLFPSSGDKHHEGGPSEVV